MGKLDLHVRPVVLFDPSNKLHRQWATAFIEHGTWKGCPVRFAVDEDHGNLMGHIQRKLILFYADQERKGKLHNIDKRGRGTTRKNAGKTAGKLDLII